MPRVWGAPLTVGSEKQKIVIRIREWWRLVGLVGRYDRAMSAIVHIRKMGTRRGIRLLVFMLRISEAVPELLWLDKSLSPGKAQTEGRKK